MNAPKGKLDFIKGLQPFFKAGEVIFAKHLPELEQQLLAFPTGKIDTLNALAYALKMRPGQPVFDGFRHTHIAEDIAISRRDPVWLIVNATAQHTAAMLAQFIKGALHIVSDFMAEGDPGTNLEDIMRAAKLQAEGMVRVMAAPTHFNDYDTIGLRAAARRINVPVTRGGNEVIGRETIRKLLKDEAHGIPSFRIAHKARWTLNAFSGGYAYPMTKLGTAADFAEPGPYRVLVEGLESFAALLDSGMTEGDSERNYAYSPSGRRYLTALAR